MKLLRKDLKLNVDRLRNELLPIAGTIEDSAERQFRLQTKVALGVDIRSIGIRREIINNFISNNIDLITDLSEKLVNDIERSVTRGVTTGASHKTIAKDLQKNKNVSKNRAKLIARDQVSKLYGEINREQQRSVGIEKFVWRTATDERVRSTHASLEGRTFSWSRPPAEGIPGEPINCRCHAEPVFDDFV